MCRPRHRPIYVVVGLDKLYLGMSHLIVIGYIGYEQKHICRNYLSFLICFIWIFSSRPVEMWHHYKAGRRKRNWHHLWTLHGLKNRSFGLHPLDPHFLCYVGLTPFSTAAQNVYRGKLMSALNCKYRSHSHPETSAVSSGLPAADIGFVVQRSRLLTCGDVLMGM